MRKLTEIVVHCTATKPTHNLGVKTIRKWHVQDNGWRDIGYHYVITRAGKIEQGRPIEQDGAHTAGHNVGTVGIALCGGVDSSGRADANFTYGQYSALIGLITRLEDTYPTIKKLSGHRDYAFKECPSFDVRALMGRT